MGRIHVGFKNKDDASRLQNNIWGDQSISRITVISRKPKTGEYLVSVETSSKEIEETIRNSGGRIISDEEYEALTGYSTGDLDDGWIISIQMDLGIKGYYLPVHPSGVFDEETKHAVMAFQRDHGLEVNGIVNEEVMERMREAGHRPSFLQTAQSLQLKGPEDWSVNINRYLYETEVSEATSTEIGRG